MNDVPAMLSPVGPEDSRPASPGSGLSQRERDILDFEAQWRRHVGAKEEAIRAQLGLTPARYYQLLGRLIDTVAAQQYDPMLARRLRRIREMRVPADTA